MKNIEFQTYNQALPWKNWWNRTNYAETWSKTSIAVNTHGADMNETYLTSYFGLRGDAVKNAWSLITGN